MTKIYECKICKRFVQKGIKGYERVRGTREKVRKHIVEVHHIRGRKNVLGELKREFGPSNITENIIAEEMG